MRPVVLTCLAALLAACGSNYEPAAQRVGEAASHDPDEGGVGDASSQNAPIDPPSQDAAVCAIGGAFYATGTPDPSNACQACQPHVSVSAWTAVTDGAGCGARGSLCHDGSCVSGCEIAGAFVAASSPNPADACQTCQPAQSISAWSTLADGVACGNGEVCVAGRCASGCDIGGVVYGPGALNPANACESCQPAETSTTWTYASDGTGCGAGQVCSRGACGSE